MPFPAWTAAEFLALWRRLFPAEYTTPLETEADGEGADVVAAFAALYARLDRAEHDTFERYYLLPHTLQTGPEASGAVHADGVVRILRAPPVDQAIELVAGTVLRAVYLDTRGAERLGPRYELMEPVVFAAGDLGPIAVPVRAQRPGVAGDVVAGSIRLFDELGTSEIEDATSAGGDVVENLGTRDRFTAGMLGRFLLFDSGPNAGALLRIVSVDESAQSVVVAGTVLAGAGDARVMEFGDVGLSVEQLADVDGGADAWLDAIGADRRVHRRLGEGDDAYRERIAELPDVVSPDAIERIARRILEPAGIRWALYETRDPSTWPGFILDVDPLDVLDEWHGYVGGCEITTAFAIAVSADDGAGWFGLVFDDGPELVSAALDEMPLDGVSIGYLSVLARFHDAVTAAKAGGVCWSLVRDPAL